MSTGVGHRWKDVFQAGGTTVTWVFRDGEREHFWAFSFRPFQANEAGVEILRHTTSSDNQLRHADSITVRVGPVPVASEGTRVDTFDVPPTALERLDEICMAFKVDVSARRLVEAGTAE